MGVAWYKISSSSGSLICRDSGLGSGWVHSIFMLLPDPRISFEDSEASVAVIACGECACSC